MFQSKYFRFALFAAALAFVFALLAGCGRTAGPNESAAQPPAPEAQGAAESAAKAGPRNIAVLYFPFADHLFALGNADAVKGVAGLKSLRTFPVYEPFLQGDAIADLGDQASMEKLIAMQPDLIIASHFEQSQAEQLSKIAKTVVVTASLDWQDTLRQVAAAIGEEAKAEAYIDGYTKRLDEVAAVMERSGQKGKSAMFMMPWKKGFTYWSGPRLSAYYGTLGFKPFEGLQNTGEISLEGLGKLNPDYLFIGNDFTHASEISLEELQTNPVWQSLDAVKNNRMFIVDTEIFGPLALGQSKGLEVMDKLMKTRP